MGDKFLARRKSKVAKVASDRAALMRKVNQTMVAPREEHHGRGAGGTLPCNENGSQTEHTREL